MTVAVFTMAPGDVTVVTSWQLAVPAAARFPMFHVSVPLAKTAPQEFDT